MPEKQEAQDTKKKQKRRKPLPPLSHSLRDVGLSVPPMPAPVVQKRPERGDKNGERRNPPPPVQEKTMSETATATATPTPNDNAGTDSKKEDRALELAMIEQFGQLLGQIGTAIATPAPAPPPPPPRKFDHLGVLELGAKVAVASVVVGGVAIGVTAAVKAIAGGGTPAPTAE